ncbi:MAG: xanthine dehydrogenase family protein subunit M [Planctomycetaceae bacterium]|nr:xanthine dehydrogenase family protein subunit M [Planctomycetaceae bacterium]
MKDFSYAAAATVDEAVSLLAAGGARARVLAGGTDIIVQLREGMREADLLVDVKKVPELMAVDYSPQRGLRLGAAVPCYRLYDDPQLCAAYPAVCDAARIIGGWQIQSRASLGGNLCNSSPAADSTPALMAHDATAHIAGPAGTRTVKVADFCTAPGRNVLERGEFLVRLELPPPAPHASSHYLRFIPRNEMDIAVVGAGAWLRLDPTGQKIEEARIALGAVAPRPLLATEASNSLRGQPATEASFAAAGELAKKIATPIDDKRGTAEYRVHLVGVLVRRALAGALERARGSNGKA